MKEPEDLQRENILQQENVIRNNILYLLNQQLS